MKTEQNFLIMRQFLMFLIFTGMLLGCGDKGDPTPPKPAKVAVKSIKLDKTEITKVVGETEQLTATVLPSNATNKAVTWSSSDDAVATVDENGKVTAKKVGTAKVTVTTKDGNKTATCSVTGKTKQNGNYQKS